MDKILKEIKNHNPNKGKVLINTHSNLNYQAGDVIYISNLINILIKQNIKVLLTSKYDIGENFMRNIENQKLLESKKINFNELDNFIDNKESELSLIIIRNHIILDSLKNQPWLEKTILYGLDIHLEGIKKIENYKKVWVQSEDIKKQYIENGIKEEKLKVIEPLVYKYDFNLPERDDNEIHLIYAGILRNEENILEIIEEFKKIHRERPEVKLKMVYGKIMGNKDFQNKIKKYIEDGIEGCKFKYNLSHRDTCYEIATSDIGICWRKKGWGENGEISTKVKEYELYGLKKIEKINVSEIYNKRNKNINEQKIENYVGIVTATNKVEHIDNIIKNFEQQTYLKKKLFFVKNSNKIDIQEVKKKIQKKNINYEILDIDEEKNLGFCLNRAIEKLKSQKYNIFSKFDDDDVYCPEYLSEQVKKMNEIECDVIGKYNTVMYIPEYNNFYYIKNFKKENRYAEICRGSTIMFRVNDERYFNEEDITGVDTKFLKNITNKGGKIYVSSKNNYIWIRYLNEKNHNWKLNINMFDLEKLNDSMEKFNIYKNLINHKIVDVSHLLASVIVTMYNSKKTIKKCLESLLNQTHKNLEIIVVDDFSEDNSVNEVKKLKEKHENIKLIQNNKNRGTYYCKNIALKNLNKNTKYILFQDSDDYSHEERIRKQIEILYYNNAKLSISLCNRYNKYRFACISQCFDIDVFRNDLGYFDINRFGADSEFLYRFYKFNNLRMFGNFNYENGTIFENTCGLKYCIPCELYIVDTNEDSCLTNQYSLNSEDRINYKKNFINKINLIKSKKELYYYF
jgi:GT2 family glycosyltransferase